VPDRRRGDDVVRVAGEDVLVVVEGVEGLLVQGELDARALDVRLVGR
jgi:hypothetical protein